MGTCTWTGTFFSTVYGCLSELKKKKKHEMIKLMFGVKFH